LHNEEVHDLQSLPNIIRRFKPRNMRWGGHVACTGRKKIHMEFWWENLRKRDCLALRRPRLNGRVTS